MRGIKREFSNLEINDIILRYKKGESYQSISKAYNCSKGPIIKLLKNNGIELKGKHSLFQGNENIQSPRGNL